MAHPHTRTYTILYRWNTHTHHYTIPFLPDPIRWHDGVILLPMGLFPYRHLQQALPTAAHCGRDELLLNNTFSRQLGTAHKTPLHPLPLWTHNILVRKRQAAVFSVAFLATASLSNPLRHKPYAEEAEGGKGGVGVCRLSVCAYYVYTKRVETALSPEARHFL